MVNTLKRHHLHRHNHEVSEKSIRRLLISFVINMLLSIAEIVGGILSGSVALIGDALHNTSDALSILIAVLAFKIGRKKASAKYTYGFKRAEVIGGFVNLILLFISGCYLLVEGIERLVVSQYISGGIIIVVSVVALIIDGLTALISHHDAGHNMNMKMVFLHNLADAMGSFGVIASGFCVLLWQIYWVDGVVALLIAGYMIYQSIIAFPGTVNILMNAAPEGLDINKIKHSIRQIEGVLDVHHVHLWQISEHELSMECHIEACDLNLVPKIRKVLADEFAINHCNIQIENHNCGCKCDL